MKNSKQYHNKTGYSSPRNSDGQKWDGYWWGGCIMKDVWRHMYTTNDSGYSIKLNLYHTYTVSCIMYPTSSDVFNMSSHSASSSSVARILELGKGGPSIIRSFLSVIHQRACKELWDTFYPKGDLGAFSQKVFWTLIKDTWLVLGNQGSWEGKVERTRTKYSL